MEGTPVGLPDYEVNVEKTREVISSTRGHVQDFDGQRTTLSTAVETAAGTANSSLIMGALQEVYDGYQGKLATVLDHTGTNVVNEADKMVNAFVAGDQQMADTSRLAADDVASTEEEAR